MAQCYGAFICFFAWASGSVSYPPAKRAVALALINCVSQFGNILGSYVLIYFYISSCRSNCYFDFQVHLAIILGTYIQYILFYLHTHEHYEHRNVFCFPPSSFLAEPQGGQIRNGKGRCRRRLQIYFVIIVIL